jgi:hypothetical protein
MSRVLVLIPRARLRCLSLLYGRTRAQSAGFPLGMDLGARLRNHLLELTVTALQQIGCLAGEILMLRWKTASSSPTLPSLIPRLPPTSRVCYGRANPFEPYYLWARANLWEHLVGAMGRDMYASLRIRRTSKARPISDEGSRRGGLVRHFSAEM